MSPLTRLIPASSPVLPPPRSSSVSSSTLSVPRVSATSSPRSSPPTLSPAPEEHEQVLLISAAPDTPLSGWSLPLTSPLSPFNPHHTARAPSDLPVDIDSSDPEEESATKPFDMSKHIGAQLALFPNPPRSSSSHSHSRSPSPEPEAAMQFAPPPGSREGTTSAMSTASRSKVAQTLGREATRGISPQKARPRPPALHGRSLSSDTASSQSHASGAGGISVSSTIYPSSGAAARESFIDLDDTLSPSYSDMGHGHGRAEAAPPRRSGDTYADDERSIDSRTSSEFYAHAPANPNAMYPTPTRAAFTPSRRPGTARSDTSQLPSFAQPAAGTSVYQPLGGSLTPRGQQRQRPQSMLVTPTSDLFFDSADDRAKPPLPKSPKPTQFLRKAAAASSGSSSNSNSQRSYRPGLQGHAHSQPQPLPPTTNTRDPGERQELIRKSRKLAQVFGEGVSGMLWPTDDPQAARARARGVVPPSARVKHRKGSHSADVRSGDNDEDRAQVLVISSGRRHSTPTSADFGDYAAMVRAVEQGDNGRSDGRPGSSRAGSPESFMELSDDDEEHHNHDHHDDVVSSPSPSHSPDAIAEQERKKMRDKLAKLHRFLGSRVPVELALGAGYALGEADLPKPASTSEGDGEGASSGGSPKTWMKRRRSSSSAVLPGYIHVHSPGGSSIETRATTSMPDDRFKDELGEKERALNVKRANKMEQMFGARPPPTLYQTRPARSSPPPSSRTKHRPTELPVLPPVQHNPNASSYRGKGRHKRPGTSESGQALLGDERSEGMSQVYMYYRHSLNSLTDIINKDDKESLAELHQYINAPSGSDDERTPGPAATFSLGSSLERRRSLPARTSLQSIASTMTVTPPSPDPRGFQQRRRRAAKLSHFFGVNYRDLFGDVLESIELGMQEEVSVGSLKADELEELLGKLRRLKTRRNEIPA